MKFKKVTNWKLKGMFGNQEKLLENLEKCLGSKTKLQALSVSMGAISTLKDGKMILDSLYSMFVTWGIWLERNKLVENPTIEKEKEEDETDEKISSMFG